MLTRPNIFPCFLAFFQQTEYLTFSKTSIMWQLVGQRQLLPGYWLQTSTTQHTDNLTGFPIFMWENLVVSGNTINAIFNPLQYAFTFQLTKGTHMRDEATFLIFMSKYPKYFQSSALQKSGFWRKQRNASVQHHFF